MILEACRHGPLVKPGCGTIIAKFDHSAYLRIAGDIYCLLPPDGEDGAIHICLRSWPNMPCGADIAIELGSSLIWTPPKWPTTTVPTLRQRLDQFGSYELADPIGHLGRGEGLTPQGDDRIAGWLMMRHALGWSADASGILAASMTRTHQISRAHLRAAAMGLGAAPFHRICHQMLDPAIAEPDLAPLKLIGHTSGQAAFEGAMAALTEFLGR